MRLKEPIKLTSICQKFAAPVRSLHLNEQEMIAAAAMQRVALVTDPTLTKEQKQVLYEVLIPELAGNNPDVLRQVSPAGQIVDIVLDTSNPKQTFHNSMNNSIPGTAGKRETVNGFILDMV